MSDLNQTIGNRAELDSNEITVDLEAAQRILDEKVESISGTVDRAAKSILVWVILSASTAAMFTSLAILNPGKNQGFWAIAGTAALTAAINAGRYFQAREVNQQYVTGLKQTTDDKQT